MTVIWRRSASLVAGPSGSAATFRPAARLQPILLLWRRRFLAKLADRGKQLPPVTDRNDP